MAKTTADDLVMGKFDLFMRATNHGGTFKVYIAEKGELVPNTGDEAIYAENFSTWQLETVRSIHERINNDFGIKAFDNTNLEIENSNFVDNQTYGLGIITEDPIDTSPITLVFG